MYMTTGAGTMQSTACAGATALARCSRPLTLAHATQRDLVPRIARQALVCCTGPQAQQRHAEQELVSRTRRLALARCSHLLVLATPTHHALARCTRSQEMVRWCWRRRHTTRWRDVHDRRRWCAVIHHWCRCCKYCKSRCDVLLNRRK